MKHRNFHFVPEPEEEPPLVEHSASVADKSIEMVRGPCPVEVPEPPTGYLMRCAVAGDADRYGHLFAASYRELNRPAPFDVQLESSLPEGFYVVEDAATGLLVAAAAAAIMPRERHPEGASLQWAMVLPECRGRGLGLAVMAAATNRLAESGFRRSYLRTQDYRPRAISIYFKLGWKPFLWADYMHGRWRAVCEAIEVNFTPEGWGMFRAQS